MTDEQKRPKRNKKKEIIFKSNLLKNAPNENAKDLHPIPKIIVTGLPVDTKPNDFKQKFAAYGNVLRATLTKSVSGKRTGHVVFQTSIESERAIRDLDEKKAFGSETPIQVQYHIDAWEWASYIASTEAEILFLLEDFGWVVDSLRSNKKTQVELYLLRHLVIPRRVPSLETLAAALLINMGLSTKEEVQYYKLVTEKQMPEVSAILEAEEKFKTEIKNNNNSTKSPTKGKENNNNMKSFDSIMSLLDEVEKTRWQRFTQANEKLDERLYFRLVDVLTTPINQLWEFMERDCKMKKGEVATCIYILTKHFNYKFSK